MHWRTTQCGSIPSFTRLARGRIQVRVGVEVDSLVLEVKRNVGSRYGVKGLEYRGLLAGCQLPIAAEGSI